MLSRRYLGGAHLNQELPRKKCILIVDDERRIGRILTLNLTLSGYEAISVTSGAEALEIAEAQKPDLMLLDIIMPDMNGFQVLERLRSFSKLPVIAFSAGSENGPKALELAANGFVGKPFKVHDMVMRVKRILEDV
jgi:DNA-binding response OmpR family regulator